MISWLTKHISEEADKGDENLIEQIAASFRLLEVVGGSYIIEEL